MKIDTNKVYLNGLKSDDFVDKIPLPKAKFELRSEEVHEILSKRPAWIIRYGLSILGLVMLLAVFISWYIKYPEIVKSSVMITTEIPPPKSHSTSLGTTPKTLGKT